MVIKPVKQREMEEILETNVNFNTKMMSKSMERYLLVLEIDDYQLNATMVKFVFAILEGL